MRDVINFLKETMGLDEEEKKEETETIIVPEHSFYEIILMKAKNLEDIDDVLVQITEEKNPVILDLSHLKKESLEDFRRAGEKIKNLRETENAEAILLCKNEKEIIIITPPEIKLIKKE
ncbi:MAG: cell division protein SepF [Methanothermobacter sp.]|nr:cell division protein SepF [Methanothermobacter sp.]